MPISRRTFLASGTLAGISTGLGGVSLAALAAERKPTRTPASANPYAVTATLTYDQFRANIGQTFEVLENQRIVASMTLREVTNLDSNAMTGPRPVQPAVYSLLLSPSDPSLAEGTYLFRHGSFGVFAMFVTPVGGPRADVAFEAVFNSRMG